MPQTVVVLGGGNALAAYHAGAFEEMVRRNLSPDWIIGASAGAITGAIIAGNPPELRVQRLREFWSAAETKTPFEASGNPVVQWFHAMYPSWSGRSMEVGVGFPRSAWSRRSGVLGAVGLAGAAGGLDSALVRQAGADLQTRGAFKRSVCL